MYGYVIECVYSNKYKIIKIEKIKKFIILMLY
jgi:hypothetical protein